MNGIGIGVEVHVIEKEIQNRVDPVILKVKIEVEIQDQVDHMTLKFKIPIIQKKKIQRKNPKL